MLEGLEISEVKFSYVRLNDIFRIDSNYFQKIFLQQEQRVLKTNSNRLIDLGCDLKSFGAYSLNNYVEYLEEGVPFVRGINLKNGRISFNNVIYISNEAHKLLWKSEVRPKTILLSMSGTIGDVAIASESLKYPINSNQDIAKISCDENLNPYYLYAFLSSYFGQNYLIREARGSVQQHVFLSQIENFQIPEFSADFYNVIENTVLDADLSDAKSQQCYGDAEQTLLEAVGLADFKPSTQNTNIKTIAQSFGSSGRLDAEYYQPKYEAFESTVKSNKYGYTFIKNEYDHFNDVSRKLKSAYHYIEISDVNVSDGTNSPILIETTELPANAKFEVKKGDLIISKVRPNRGAITVIEEEFDNLIVSGAFTVLREKPSSVFTKEVLKVLLRTPVYREWMLQFNVGTQYPVIRDEDILNLPIPKIDLTTQTNISQLVQQSFSLKAQSEHLLNVAKRAVEIAIEQDEAAAMHFIENSQ